jgi:3D (Asp-Asp-Asp) domain-containing protein
MSARGASALALGAALVAAGCAKLEREPRVPASYQPPAESPTGTFDATAYSVKGETAGGTRARTGVVAADPKVLPLGSRIEVQGAGEHSGIYTVEDTGPAIKGHKIDVFVPDAHKAKKFGRKKVRVKVLKRGDGKVGPSTEASRP